MVTFYVSTRPIMIEGTRLLSPKLHLGNGFKGIPVVFKCIGNGHAEDGRWLYEIETDTLEHQDIILEGLQMWGAHLKTLDSAKALADKLTGIVWTINTTRGKIIPPPPKKAL